MTSTEMIATLINYDEPANFTTVEESLKTTSLIDLLGISLFDEGIILLCIILLDLITSYKRLAWHFFLVIFVFIFLLLLFLILFLLLLLFLILFGFFYLFFYLYNFLFVNSTRKYIA